MAPGHGRVDYLLYVDKRVCGVIKAKPEGTGLSGVEWQSAMYATGLPEQHRKRAVEVERPAAVAFGATCSETHLTNGLARRRGPVASRASRSQRPSAWLRDQEAHPAAPTLRARVTTACGIG
jgi:type I restriction enzyme R subunit